MKPVTRGAPVLICSPDAEGDRAFFRDGLGFDSVDSGGRWLIFALPPAELAIHPTKEEDNHELYLLCEDIEATAKELERRNVPITRPFHEQQVGRLPRATLPPRV